MQLLTERLFLIPLQDRAMQGLIERTDDPGNAASQAVLRKNGFVPTGTLGEEGPRFILRKNTAI